MPIVKIYQTGKAAIETLVDDGATYGEALRALGVAEDLNLMKDGATPVAPGDVVPGTGNATVALFVKDNVKGA